MKTLEKKEKYKKQTDDLYSALGKYLCSFEQLCESLRRAVMLNLTAEGLKNSNISYLITGKLNLSPLNDLYQSLNVMLISKAALNTQNKEFLKKISKRIFNNVNDIGKTRNLYIHSTHYIGWGNEFTEDFSVGSMVKFSPCHETGLKLKRSEITTDSIDSDTLKLNELITIINRLSGYLAMAVFREIGNPVNDEALNKFLNKK